MMRMLLLFGLAGAVVATGLRIVVVQEDVRGQNRALATLQGEIRRLDEEWSQLLLEQATWARFGRVEELARTQHRMDYPRLDAVVHVDAP
jgi:cell division protein FtsL